MSDHDKIPSRYFSDSSHKHIEVTDGHHVTENQKVQVQIKRCDNNRDNFIVTLHNVLLVPDICDTLFSTITLMNLRHTCLFQKGFFTVYFVNKEKIVVTLPHIAQQKHTFWGEIKQMSKTKKLAPREKLL